MKYIESASKAGLKWKKASASGTNNNCVMVAKTADGLIAVCDSKNFDGPGVLYTEDEWAAFLSGAKAGEFDI